MKYLTCPCANHLHYHSMLNFILFLINCYSMLVFSTTLVGAILLYLPYTGKKPITFIDALFIASSAFTVTGLSPVDIGAQFNLLGEVVILLLIQIGGLGIVTVTMLIFVFLNKKGFTAKQIFNYGHMEYR